MSAFNSLPPLDVNASDRRDKEAFSAEVAALGSLVDVFTGELRHDPDANRC